MQPLTVADVLSEAGIRVRSYAAGRTEHTTCPVCAGGRTKEKSLAVTIDADGGGATWVCHRGSCVSKPGGARVREDRPVARQRLIKAPPVHTEGARTNRPTWLYDWFAERCIGARVVNLFGVYAGQRWFGDDLGELDAIVFPFTWQGEVRNRKYRPREVKRFAQESDALPTIFNIDAAGNNPEQIVWCEGEADVMAFAECGINHAVTLKDGAPSVANAVNQARFEALATHTDVLSKAKRIVLAGDSDGPGMALREELARRLGRHRCWVVTWPVDCKDCCDVLRVHGPDAVLACIETAQPYPIEGLRRIVSGSLLALQDQRAPAVMSTGTMASDGILKLPTEGRCIIVAGFPSAGKTTWARFVMVHTAANHSRRWAVFSPESQPWEHFMAHCAETHARKPFWPIYGIPHMSRDEIIEAEAFLADRVTMIVCDAGDQAPTLDWLLEKAEACVLRDGTTDFLIDPVNEVEQTRGQSTETEWIGRFIQRWKAFGLRHGCNVWMIVHPAKPMPIKPGEKRPAPGPYDLAGSAHWANKPDVGLTVHSPNPGLAELHIWKAREGRWGRKGTKTEMEFDHLSGTYTTPVEKGDSDPPANLFEGQSA